MALAQRNLLRHSCSNKRALLVCRAQACCVRVCTGKVCKKQGSQQVLKFAQDLGLEEVDVADCGCLGNCGNGPNMVILPEGIKLGHVATPHDMAEIFTWQLKVDVPQQLIRATELRLAGNTLAMSGDLEGAIARYKEALDLSPERGTHMLHSNLSAAYLQQGNKGAALEHAQAAVAAAPRGFHIAYVRLIDSLYSLGKFKEAAGVMQDAVVSDPTVKNLQEYKLIQQALRKAGVRQGVAA